MELSTSNIKKIILTFPQKKLLYFLKRKLIIFFYISGNGTLHFSAQAQKNRKNPPRKKFLIFLEMELSNSNIKKILIFSQKKTFPIFSQKKVLLIFSQKKTFLNVPEMELCTFQPKDKK